MAATVVVFTLMVEMASGGILIRIRWRKKVAAAAVTEAMLVRETRAVATGANSSTTLVGRDFRVSMVIHRAGAWATRMAPVVPGKR